MLGQHVANGTREQIISVLGGKDAVGLAEFLQIERVSVGQGMSKSLA